MLTPSKRLLALPQGTSLLHYYLHVFKNDDGELDFTLPYYYIAEDGTVTEIDQ